MLKNKFDKHIIIQENLDNNPELVDQGIKVGDEVFLSESLESIEVIVSLQEEVKTKELEITDLQKEVKALTKENLKLKKSAEKVTPVAEFKNTDGEVIVHFGVNINGTDYTVADILGNKEIQNYLLDIGSGAIEKVTEG